MTVMTGTQHVVALRQGGLLQICIDLLMQHQDDGTGRCAGCGQLLASCASRRNCRKVISAAGFNPAKFDLPTLFEGCAYVRAELIVGMP